MTGGLVAIAGISRYDADHRAAAQRYVHQALRFAKASGDRAFGAYVVALLVNQALGVEAFKDTVELSDVGLRAASECGSSPLASDLLAMRAKALAHLGERRAALECARDAVGVTSRQDGDEPPPRAFARPRGTRSTPRWPLCRCLSMARGMESRRLWRRFGDIRCRLADSSANEVVSTAVAEIDDALLLSV